MLKKIVLLLSVISLSFFAQPASASSHAKSLKNLGMNEIMFAQGMIPHHQRPRTRCVGGRSRPAQRIAEHRKVRRRAGTQHHGHPRLYPFRAVPWLS